MRPTAVVVSGGKQYRVGVGDRILVDRLTAEPGSSVKLGRVLMFSDGGEVRVGKAAADLDVDATVIGHPRGPRVESIRYKSKKRVRVHHGGRAHLTSLEIIAVGGVGVPSSDEAASEEAPRPRRGRAKAAVSEKTDGKKAAGKKGDDKKAARAQAAAAVVEEKAAAPKKTTRKRTRKETE